MKTQNMQSQSVAANSSCSETSAAGKGRDGRSVSEANASGRFTPLDRYPDKGHPIWGRVPRGSRSGRPEYKG